MLDKLTEALIKARDVAVEERNTLYGPTYASALEGYGDLSRELLNLQDDTKAIKKCVTEVVGFVGAQELQELYKALILMEGKMNAVAYDALRMLACVRRFQETVKAHNGGDLLDLLGDEDDA